MPDLTPREVELVALGAALGSNCVACIEYHIPQARKAGLTEAEIHAAIQLADKVRQVPARKVLETALILLPQAAGGAARAAPGDGCCCGGSADRTIDTMASMMSKMMSSCAAACGCAVSAKEASNE